MKILTKLSPKGRLLRRRISIFMTLLIATTHPSAILTIPLPKLGKIKPHSLMIWILLTMAKSAAVPPTEKTENASTVADILLS